MCLFGTLPPVDAIHNRDLSHFRVLSGYRTGVNNTTKSGATPLWVTMILSSRLSLPGLFLADVKEDSSVTTEVRFYPAAPREGVVWYKTNRWYETSRRDERRAKDHRGQNDRMEFDGGHRTRATWNGFGPVRFPNPNLKLLLPVAGQRFANFEDLGDALRDAGYLVTDLTKTLGRVADPYTAMALLADRVVETFNREIIIIRRFADGTHEHMWQLDDDVFDTLRRSKLVSRSATAKYGNCGRQIYEWGPMTLETISDPHHNMLAYTMERVGRKQSRERETLREAASNRPEASDVSMHMKNVVPFPVLREDEGNATAIVPALVPWSGRTQRRPKNPVAPSSVAAHDDNGGPILEIEVTREQTRTAPRNMPTNLIPEAPDGCSDDEWERLMLIEQIKYRRRMAAIRAAGSGP